MTCHIKPIQVVKYLRFTNVPPSVTERDFSKSTRPTYNDETRSLISKLVDGSHEVAKGTLNAVLGLTLNEMGLLASFADMGRYYKICSIWPISATVKVKICGIADQPQGPLPRGTLQK